MPAKSKKQQRLFAMALAQKRGKMKGSSKKVKELSNEMTEQELEKFAKTKHKGLKENYVQSFLQFINEDAYVDDEGQLRDLEFSEEEQYEIEAYDSIIGIRDFLEESGAKNVKYKTLGGALTYTFTYLSEDYMIRFDLDDTNALVVKAKHEMERSSPDVIYHDDSEGLMDLISAKGLDFLLGI